MSVEADSSRRDHLALVRTDLANERTLLAYGRTALMMAATGFSLIKFFPESQLLLAAGWVMSVLGVTLAMIGLYRFSRLRKRLRGDR